MWFFLIYSAVSSSDTYMHVQQQQQLFVKLGKKFQDYSPFIPQTIPHPVPKLSLQTTQNHSVSHKQYCF